jgi:hypothetical protein
MFQSIFVAMIVYNVTVNVDIEVVEDWLNWMKTIHIPEVLETGFFKEAKLMRVHAEEEGGQTYAIQYTCFTFQDLENYHKTKAPVLQSKHVQRYGNKAVAFRTILEEIHHLEKDG